MNSSNPFKVPTCFQRADLQQRRRERFRKGVVATVAAVAALLVILLVQGCVNEHAKISENTSSPMNPALVAANGIASAKPVSPPALPVLATPQATPQSAPATALSNDQTVEAVYVVKPGDTLTRIANLHQTSVKALKTVNNLDSDTIIVGDTLKLPST